MERKRLIRITKNQVFLTPELCLNLSQTSLVGTHLSFRSVQDIYLEVEVLEYDKGTNKISLNVIDYQPKDIEKFKEQTAKAQVSFIYFNPLKWQQIEKHLTSYTKAILVKEKIVIDDGTTEINYSTKTTFSGITKGNSAQYTENLGSPPLLASAYSERRGCASSPTTEVYASNTNRLKTLCYPELSQNSHLH